MVQNRLEVSTQQMQVQTGEQVTAAQDAVAEANSRAVAAEEAAAVERQGRIAAEGEIARMQALLQSAQDTAREAAGECSRLHAAVLSVSEVRHALSHRAKFALVVINAPVTVRRSTAAGAPPALRCRPGRGTPLAHLLMVASGSQCGLSTDPADALLRDMMPHN